MLNRGPCTLVATRRDGRGGEMVVPLNSPEEYVFHTDDEVETYLKSLEPGVRRSYVFHKVAWTRISIGMTMTRRLNGKSPLKSDYAAPAGPHGRGQSSPTKKRREPQTRCDARILPTPYTYEVVSPDVRNYEDDPME